MRSIGGAKEHVVFSFHEPETESKLSGHACRGELPGSPSLGPEPNLGTPH